MELALKRALERVRREDFIPEHLKAEAASDRPLPIGGGQSISQPSLVAFMTQKLQMLATHRVLEIGTGSGYQTALLAELAAEVFTVERLTELSLRAQATLVGLGYRNIQYKIGSGYEGWAEHGPYDRVMVTAAADQIPMDVFQQMKSDGRMIIPMREGTKHQVLYSITKRNQAPYIEALLPVEFVPMVH